MTPASAVRLSPLDSERFGITAARLENLTRDSLGAALEFCSAHSVQLLIAQCSAGEHAAIHAAQRERFELMDTILAFERRFGREPLPAIEADVEVRPARPGEEESVIELAGIAFRGYMSHYQADPRLDRARTAEVYPDWTRRLLAERDSLHEVLVAESDGTIVGFHALEQRGDCVALPLSAVRPGTQGRHLYQTMNIRGMEWAVARGAHTMTGSVQLANTPIQRALVRLGYLPSHASLTFHKWFD